MVSLGIGQVPAASEAGFSPGGSKEGRSPLKDAEVFCSIAARSLLSPSYYHSFGVTENYVVFLEQPFKLDILKMATAYIRGVSWASCLAFHGEDKVRPGWGPPCSPRTAGASLHWNALPQLAPSPDESRSGSKGPPQALRSP